MSLTHSPADVIRYLLVAQSLGSLPSSETDWPISEGEEADALSSDVPDSAIFVRGTESSLAARRMNDGKFCERYGVQVRVRAHRGETARAKADAIAAAMDEDVDKTSVTISSSVYLVHVISRTGGVLDLGKEPGTSRHQFSINALVALEQTT